MTLPGQPAAFFGTPAVRLSRWYAAAPGTVFTAFTDPAMLREWFKPRGFEMEWLHFDARVDGRYGARLRGPDGTVFEYGGVVLEVVPPARLVYTWRWREGPLDRAETLVELTFAAERDGTRVNVCHSRFTSDGESAAHVTGWGESLDRFGEWLAERPVPPAA